MKINDLLTEDAIVPYTLKKAMIKKGYKRLGGGMDAMAFLEPGTGLVLKIIGSRLGPDGDSPFKGIPKAHTGFIAFATFCQRNPNNPFLPQFSGWETFEFEGRSYIQVRMERLFPLRKTGWGEALETMADHIGQGPNGAASKEAVEDFIEEYITAPKNHSYYGSSFEELGSYLGIDGLTLLWNTIIKLIKNKPSGMNLDLHGSNFMLGSDGHIVISDPYYSGYTGTGS